MRYLGLDLGTRSLGVALSDRLGHVASFYKNIKGSSREFISMIKDIVIKEDVECIVLGLPKNMNNSLGERALDTIKFKELLEQELNIKVVLEDERLTTKIAESVLIGANMSRKKRKEKIDGLSAVVILQSYLDKEEINND